MAARSELKVGMVVRVKPSANSEYWGTAGLRGWVTGDRRTGEVSRNGEAGTAVALEFVDKQDMWVDPDDIEILKEPSP